MRLKFELTNQDSTGGKVALSWVQSNWNRVRKVDKVNKENSTKRIYITPKTLSDCKKWKHESSICRQTWIASIWRASGNSSVARRVSSGRKIVKCKGLKETKEIVIPGWCVTHITIQNEIKRKTDKIEACQSVILWKITNVSVWNG